jgi:oligopeptide transport system substrate-binding protein
MPEPINAPSACAGAFLFSSTGAVAVAELPLRRNSFALLITRRFAGRGLLLSVLLACACRPLPPADLTVINGADPGSIDPLLVSGIEELRAVLPLFEGLARPDPVTGQAIPALAENWHVSADGLTYTFQLRTNAVWSTGEPIRADDVLYSWRRVLEPTNSCQYAALLFPVRGAEDFLLGRTKDFASVAVRAHRERTVEVTLANPCPWFLDLCAFQTLAVVPQSAIERHGDAWTMRHPPFSGPYELVFWRLNDRIRLQRNERHWDAANTHSRVVDLLSVALPTTALNLYLSGRADVIWDKPLVPAELLPELEARPDYHTFPMLGSYFVRLNVTRPALADPRVRRAFALTVDKARLVRRHAPACEPADHLVPPASANYFRGEGQRRDPELARQLLAQAGFPGGKGFPKLSYLCDSSGGGGARLHERVAVELQETWRQELGVEIEIRQMEKQVYLLAQRQLDYDFSRSSWIGDYNDPNTFLDLFTSANGNNRTGWKNAEFDRLMAASQQVTDGPQRRELLQRAEKLLVWDEVPVIPLWFEAGFTLYDAKKWAGIHGNLLDVHPLNSIKRVN